MDRTKNTRVTPFMTLRFARRATLSVAPVTIICMTELRLSNAQARRVALAAQGIGQACRDGPVTMRRVQGVIDSIGQFQIDSVNVLARAHLMPLFSRLGVYDTALLTRATSQTPRRLFEYWGHAASLIDVNLYPALRFRMADAHPWASIREIVDQHPDAPNDLVDAIRQRGPSTARDLNTDTAPKGRGWWNWSSTKTLLEWLFHAGQVAVVRRNNAFERVFDLPERVLPAAVAQAPPLSRPDAHVVLVRRAAAALGVATARSLADYFRTSTAETRLAIDTLVDAGELIPVTVDDSPAPTWMWHQARRPRSISAAALVSPFDSVAFERRRLAGLFGVDYTIGLYTPAAQRTHGYYVYLFILDDAIVARTDLKADRQAGVLRVQSAWLEDAAAPQRVRVATELVAELRRLAQWLGLANIAVTGVGDLASQVEVALG